MRYERGKKKKLVLVRFAYSHHHHCSITYFPDSPLFMTLIFLVSSIITQQQEQSTKPVTDYQHTLLCTRCGTVMVANTNKCIYK